MHESDDLTLLRKYASRGADDAFAELVSRRVGFVYSAALRQVRDPHLAGEIAQAVFIILAQKAGKISDQTVLTGWLFKTTRYTALAHIRATGKRRRHELEAHMQNELSVATPDPLWEKMSPLLDEALATLGETDRQAVLLRFFENKSLAEVGQVLGTGEDTARKRVSRALEKLHRYFNKHGVSSTTAIIAGAMATNSVHAAPAMLAKTVAAVALAKGAAASGSTLTLIKGASKIMAWTKTKMAVAVGLGMLLATGTATIMVREIYTQKFNPSDFQATTYPTGPADMMQYFTNSYGHPLNYSFPISPAQGCSINGLLNQCMEVSGWKYLMDKDVAAGSVKFGCPKVMNGEEWVAAFENALQTGLPGWWDGKTRKWHQENLVLIRFPKEKTVLVLPKEKAKKYQ